MKTEEPSVEKARDAEILLIAIDCSNYSTEDKEQFYKLRHAAEGMAKKRLLFGLRDDLLGVFKLGSTVTNNNLAKLQDGGYLHIEHVFPAVRSSLETIKCIQGIDPESVNFLGLDSLEVLGDYLVSFESVVAKTKRVCLFSHSKYVSVKPSDDELTELISTCDLYRKENIRIDIVCCDWLDDDYDIDDEDDIEAESLTSSQYFERAAKLGIPAIWALARATGGIVASVDEATDEVTMPVARTKRPFARYRGTLDIGSIVQIPVKSFYVVSETKRDNSTKLSWAASQSEQKQVGVLVEPQKVVFATDSNALQPEQLISAYRYGTDLVPVKNHDVADAWSYNLECSLSTIAFILVESVPVHWLMSPVNAIVPMRDVHDAKIALHALVQALHDDNKGILARWVPRQKGGAPIMVFLWPVIEVDDSGCVKNRFLYSSELPLKEDVRDYPFSNLKRVRESLSLEAESAMDEFIDSRMLGGGGGGGGAIKKKEEDVMEEDEEQDLELSETCNPALDRFYAAVVQRALDGKNGSELVPLSTWQKKLLNPNTFIAEGRRDAVEKSVQRLKVTLAVSRVPPKEGEKKKVREALSGEAMSISDFLPPETGDEQQQMDTAQYLGAEVEEW